LPPRAIYRVTFPGENLQNACLSGDSINVGQTFHRTTPGYRRFVAKLIYRPIGLLVSVLGGILAGALFKQMWKRVSDKEDPPRAKESEYGWREVLPAAALQGALFGLVKAAVDRSGARAFQKVTGSWPGD
jgi:hypothetical protein